MNEPKNSKPTSAAIEAELSSLRRVLEVEREAILRADARTLGQLAVEKERLTVRVVEVAQGSDPETLAAIEGLRKDVAQLAHLNHELLGQLYQHYHGMLEMLVKIAGQKANTYGRSGLLDMAGAASIGKPKLTV